MIDALIVGKGPAGIISSIYVKRAGFTPVVIGKDKGALEKTKKIENYYGFAEPITGTRLLEDGIKQAENLGILVKEEEVVGITFENHFLVKTNQNIYEAKTVILATGASRKTPDIQGIKAFEGKGVSYCATCDGFFYQGKDVAVLGNGDYAIAEATELLPIAKTVTILTNGLPAREYRSEVFMQNEKTVMEIKGEQTVKEVRFVDDSKLNVDGIFVAEGVASSTDLAKKIGAQIENNKIKVDEKMHTNVPGLFACGDCTGGIFQIVKATYEGTIAGLEAVNYLKK